jgi:putative FmdB family regulatory protein
MPIYEYQCESCHRLTEALLKVGERGPKKCEHCGGKLTRVISRTSFQLKGGGWYKDLYASSKPEGSGDGESSSSSPSSDAKDGAKTEAKPETKTAAKTDKPAKESSKPAAAPAKASKSAAKKTG